MTQQNDDSALFNLRELMKLETQRVDEERKAKADAEADRRRRATEERERAVAETERRALAAEQARLEAEQIARESQRQIETERAERELRVRLEVEQQRRIDAQSVRLAHAERMAGLELATTRKGVSPGTVAGLFALALGAVGTAGFIAYERAETRVAVERMASSAPIASTSTPTNDNAALRALVSAANERAAQAQRDLDAIRAHATAIVRPGARPIHHHVPAGTRTETTPAPGEYDRLLDGPDPVGQTGLEGNRRRGASH